MSYKEKPQIKLYKYENSNFVYQAIIDDYLECSFENNRFQAGQFSITINYNIPNALLFERGLFVQFGDNPYNFGEILNVSDSIGSDGKGSQVRLITGYDIRYIFKRRIIKNLNNNDTWAMTAKGELCIRNLIQDQCGINAEVKRRLPVINTIPSSENAIGSEYSVSESFSNLYDVLTTIATQTEIGWRINFNGETLTLEFYSGEDKHTTVRFDTDYESLNEGQFTDSSSSFANAIFVGGKGTGSERDIYEGENAIEGDSPSGLDRFEAWDNQSEMTTEEDYAAEAISMLTQYGQTLQVSGKGLAKCPYEYGEEYEVGDVITIAFSGKSAIVQILSVTEHWTFGNYNLDFEFGKPQPDLNQQLQLLLRQIQKASSKTEATESVKWYTMTSDVTMDSGDVTFNTIGFTGNIGAGKTFTFYLDDEKTGSKNYTVYVKNLTGTGKLTLTSGKTGATNIQLSSGNYIGKIYIDEDGNIILGSLTATNTVESGNNQPVTSGAVAEAIASIDVSHADTADKLTTARNLKVALDSANAQAFDGSANAESIGVSGTLPVANGGTGQTDLANVNVGSATSSERVSATNITIKTGSTAQAKISLNTLMAWLMHNDRKYIPSGVNCYRIITTSWSYANNDILQLAIDGVNYELQLAGVVIEFMGNSTDYQTGMFRLRIHSSPTTSFTATSGYTIFPVNHIAEYTCNGSSYSPTWEMLLGVGDSARALSGTYTCSTAAATAAKTVTVPGFKLAKGARLTIVLSNANTAASALTMNVNGTGAKTIRWNGTVTSTSTYAMTATTYMCYYDGTYWNMDSSFEVYSARVANGPNGVSSAQGFGALAYCGTAAATAAKTASCYGYKLIIGQPFKIYVNTANTASSPTLNIASTGAKNIFINGVAASTSNLTAGWYVGIYDGNYYQLFSSNTSVLPAVGSAVCHTAAATAAKVATMPNFKLQSGETFLVTFTVANSASSVLTLNVNNTGAKNIYINNTVTSSSNKTLPAGTYLCRYNGSYYYIDTEYFVSTARYADSCYNSEVTISAQYASLALKIRTSVSSPSDGDIWIE